MLTQFIHCTLTTTECRQQRPLPAVTTNGVTQQWAKLYNTYMMKEEPKVNNSSKDQSVTWLYITRSDFYVLSKLTEPHSTFLSHKPQHNKNKPNNNDSHLKQETIETINEYTCRLRQEDGQLTQNKSAVRSLLARASRRIETKLILSPCK